MNSTPLANRYRFYHPFFLSFFSQDLYQDVARAWRGVSFTYLLVLQTISLLILTFFLQMQFSAFVQDQAPAFVSQLPLISVADGQLSTPEDRPYILEDPSDGTPIVVIDTSGEYTSLENTEAVFLATADTIYVRQNDYETRSFDLQELQLPDFQLDQESILNFVYFIGDWILILAFPVSLFFLYLGRIIQALFFSLISLIMASIAGVRLPYASLLRLTVVAMTPILLIETVLASLTLSIPGWGWIGFLILLGYLFFAVTVNQSSPGTSDPAP